jgi:Zn-dependent protease with chaperone function
MNFFEAQEAARKRSGLLVLLFALAVVAIIAVIYAVVHVALGPGAGPIDPLLLAQVAAGIVIVIVLGSATRTASLRRGGPAVAELLGGRRVATDTTDLEERKLINVVEEMAIASGTPVPAIYVVDGEDSINAFAAGYSTHDAAVAVTRGALRQFTREELQGVIAHEFSHILNGDMRLNIRLIGLLYGILLLAVIGRGLVYFGPRGGRGRGGRDGGGGAILLVAFALLLVGYIGVFFGKLIKAAVSRQREYLADSAAVEFTRNPDGLANALKKIAGAPTGSRIEDHHAEELSHLFFANGMKRSLFGFLSTHPPIDDRIRRLDPSWEGSAEPGAYEDRLESEVAGAAGLHGGGGGTAVAPPVESAPAASGAAAGVVASVGSPTFAHLQYADELLANMPEPLRRAAHEPDGACALVFALIISTGEPGRDAEVLKVARDFGSVLLEQRVASLIPVVRAHGAGHRLLLLDLLLPALQTMSPSDAERFIESTERAVRADGQVKLFELTLLHIVARRLRGPDADERGGRTIKSFSGLGAETRTLLSGLAWAGGGWRRDAAEAAFEAGARRLPSEAGNLKLAEQAEVSVEGLARALHTFQRTTPPVRRKLLEACAECALHDRRIEPAELEVLLAVSEALDCPMPPLVT